MADMIATTGLTVLGVLLGLFLLFRFLSKASTRRDSSPIDIGPLDARTLPDSDPQIDLSEYPGITGGPLGSPAPAGPLPLEALAEQPESSRMRASIDRMSATDPKRTAEYLRSLMDDKQPA